MRREDSPAVSRRRWLRALGVASVAGAGLGGVGTAAAEGGDEVWRFETSGTVTRSPTVVDGTVYVGSGDGNLYAVDAESGTQEWQFQTGDDVDSSPTVVDGTVYVGSGDGNLYAVDAESGTQEWQFQTGLGVESSPTVKDGTVYVGSRDGNLYAVDAESGTQEWQFQTGSFIYSSPTVVEGTVYIGSNDGNLYAVDADSGTQAWQFETGDAVLSSPTVADDTVYVGSLDRYFYAVDASSGTQEWRVEMGQIASSPTVMDGTVYVAPNSVWLYALDGQTGAEEWVFEADVTVTNSPTVAGGTVYVGSYSGKLHAVDVASGTRKWVFDDGDAFETASIVVDGTVYIGAATGDLLAIDAGVSGSSDGSRVMLGTLGHHGSWAEQATTSGGAGSGFDPATHGFGFDNWARSGDEYPDHDHEAVSLDEVREVIDESWQTRLAETVALSDFGGPVASDALALHLYILINQGSATNGHCYGMVQAADEYYQQPDELPVSAEVASAVPEPTGRYEPVGDDIDYYHNTQLLSLDPWLAALIVHGEAAIDYRAQLDAITNAIDETGTAGLSLGNSVNGNGHQLLATGYTEAGDTVEVEVYDPNTAAGGYSDGEGPPPVTFDTSGAETTVEPYDNGLLYDRIAYTNVDQRIAPTEMLAEETAAAADWFESALTDVVAFATRSPVDLTVTDPNGRELGRISAEGMSLAPTEYDHLRSDVGDTASEYDGELVGTDDGEYALEVRGQDPDGAPVSTTVEGEITDGETHTYRTRLPEDAGGDIRVTATGDTPPVDGDGPPLAALGLGGGLAAGGIGYGLYRRLSADGERQSDD